MNDAILITTVVADVVRPVVVRALGRTPGLAHAVDDVVADVQVKLVERVQAWRDGHADPVDNLAGYAATAATHACYGLLRQRFPNRTRLRNRIRYMLTHHPAMLLTEDPPGVWRCALRRLRRRPAAGSTQQLLDDPHRVAQRAGLLDTTATPALIEGLLACCDIPVDVDRFVDAVAALLGIRDAIPDAQQDEQPDPTPQADATLADRSSLEAVWAEITQLPTRQRTALLLNMRDPDGGGLLDLLPTTGVASRGDIARALELSPEALDDLWPTLPLDDLTIAARLGITRQQVINLRKSGRARLARRLAVISPPGTHHQDTQGHAR